MLRYERKYLVPVELIDSLRKRLWAFVIPDKNAIKNENGIFQYTVRSIYFDTYDLECYHQKSDGLLLRRKLRIRGYNSLSPDSKVILEIKRKIGNRIKKHRSSLFFKDVNELFLKNDLEKFIIKGARGDSINEARRFFYHLKKSQFAPTNLVVYEREAYQGKIDNNVRITFDKNIRSKLSHKTELLYDDHNLKPLFNNSFVLEIKYFNDQMPVWARSIVQEFKLRNDAISKYTIGYDVPKFNKKLTY